MVTAGRRGVRAAAAGLAALLVGCAAPEPAPPASHGPSADTVAGVPSPFTPTADYLVHELRGFRVLVNPELAQQPALCGPVLDVLDAQLQAVARAVPDRALTALRQVPIWVERAMPKTACMCFHVSRGWLLANGYNPDKALTVEVGNAETFLAWTRHQPWMVLHELAHAYHFRVLGADHAEVRAAWQRAVASGGYDRVLNVFGREERHYALNNDREFFAEMSEAWFGTNDFYPFVAAELEQHDPETAALIGRLWRAGP